MNPKLDAELFKEQPDTYALAMVVSEEIEAQREAENKKQPAPTTLKGLLGGDIPSRVQKKPWHQFVTDMSVLIRCSNRLGLSRPETVERIYKELVPPNWEALFWMHAFLENINSSAYEIGTLERRNKEAERQALSAGAAELGRSGAKARDQKNKQAREFVCLEWVKHRVEYEDNKSAFTRVYVRRVKHEFDVDITDKQMREVWLKTTPSSA